MRSALVIACLVGVGAGVARADAVCAPPRRAMIPGGVETHTREVYVPACTEERRVPIYEVTQEPIYGCRTVPQTGAIAKDVQNFRHEPIYEIRRTPICGHVSETVYAQLCRPIMGVDLFSWCEDRKTPWGYRTIEVPCGTKRVPKVLGYKEERVQIGTARVPCAGGFRIEKQFLGYGQEQIVVGMREVRRIVRYVNETVIVRPARYETVTETFQRPGRWVTVSDAATRPDLLPGTEELMTEAQFAGAVRASATPVPAARATTTAAVTTAPARR
jgi:hypothetical protein